MTITIPLHWRTDSIEIPLYIKIANYLINNNHYIIFIVESSALREYLTARIDNKQKMMIYNVRDYKIDDISASLTKIVKKYKIKDWKELCFPQMIRSGRSYKYYGKLLCQSVYTLEDILANYKIDANFNYLGGEIKRRIIDIFSQKYNFLSLYLSPSIFPDRVFYFDNELFKIKDFPPIKSSNPTLVERKQIIKYFRNIKSVTKNTKLEDNPVNTNLSVNWARGFTDIGKEFYEKLFIYGSSYETPIIKKRLRKFVNRYNHLLSARLYTNIDNFQNINYVYFPLQWQLESEQTVRGRLCTPQSFVIDIIAQQLPNNTFLILKEHPDVTGGITKNVRQVINSHSNIKLVPSYYNSKVLIKYAEAIINIAGTTGLESLAYLKRPIIIGNAYYKINEVTADGSNLGNIGEMIKKVSKKSLNYEDVISFFTILYRKSFPGIFHWSGKEGFFSSKNIKLLAEGFLAACDTH